VATQESGTFTPHPAFSGHPVHVTTAPLGGTVTFFRNAAPMLAGAAVAAGFFWLAGSAAQASITMSCTQGGIKDISLLSVSANGLKKDEIGEDTIGPRKPAPKVSDIIITREIDKASPKFAKIGRGDGLGECTIHLDKSDKGRPTEYLTYVLTDTMVSSFSVATGPRPVETIKLTFRKIEVTDREKGASDSSTFTKESPKPH
jgi:type VI secretion system Hcp family effector